MVFSYRSNPKRGPAADGQTENIPEWARRLMMIVADHSREIERLRATQEKNSARKKRPPKNFVPLQTAIDSEGANGVAFSYEMVRVWLSKGAVQGEKIGGEWFVDVRSLDEFAALTPKERGLRLRASVKKAGQSICIFGGDTNGRAVHDDWDPKQRRDGNGADGE